jgi:ATP-dependent DNA helicase RecQ
MAQNPKSILKSVFGYDDFRPLQAEIIDSVLNKNDALVIMPTGGGKSICYQIPALIFDGLTVVVSPLISLMKDQVDQLRELGAPAIYLNSSLSPEAYRENMTLVRENKARLLYIAPETLLKPTVLGLLASVRLDCLTIDEAHCISEWGHDFRPEYRQLAEVRSRFPQAVCIALTATATPRVRRDIKASLRLSGAGEFLDSFDRKNLFLRIAPKADAWRQAIGFLNEVKDGSGIIYCATRQQVDNISDALARNQFSARPYHAGLSEADRTQNQEWFIRNDAGIIVATVAFGMGIDKPNIRFVLHYDLPKNVETYYQQIGRAGRDGLRSECLLLFGQGDVGKIKYFINQKEGREKKIAYDHLDAMLDLAETDDCRRVPLLRYFGETYAGEDCGMCDNCLRTDEDLVDLTIPAQKFLSCVKRTGEIFGANHIVDVLRGSESQRIFRHNHQTLSTYGIGGEYSKKQWISLSRLFLRKGLMVQDDEFGGLKLTDKAWAVFRNEKKVLGRLQEETRPKASVKPVDIDYDPQLFQQLRQKRKELADAANVPPYAVFPDKTLMEMAAYFPQSEASLPAIHGVGEVKLEKYGAVFLGMIREYCRENDIEEVPKPAASAAAPRPAASSKPPSQRRPVVIGEAYNDGRSVADLAIEFNIKQRTVIDNLYRYVQEEGGDLRPDGLEGLITVGPGLKQRALEAFEALGADRLRPVFDALGETVGFDDLQLIRLIYLSQA